LRTTGARFPGSALFWAIAVCSSGVFATNPPPGADPSDWIFLDNGVYRLGVIKSAGAGIGYLSRSDSTRNLLNHYDRGRLIQQSYYGDADGSKWVDQPWCLNPVQGGSYENAIPKLIELRARKTQLYSKSVPLHWATGELLEDFEMEQWIELKGALVQLRFRMTYKGAETHAARHQEIPAVFLDSSLSHLAIYQGDSPGTGAAISRFQPGRKNEYYQIPEHWAAFVNESDVGLGIYVPIAEQLTTYRFPGGANSDCSYLAPIATFAFKPGLTFEYDAYVCLGSLVEIRTRFLRLEGDLERVMRGESVFGRKMARKATITDPELFADFPRETPNENLIDGIAEALEKNIGKPRQSGHNVIFASIAIRALKEHPELATPSVVVGIRKLIHQFDGAHPGSGYYGKERGRITGNKIQLPEETSVPPYKTLAAMGDAVIAEILAQDPNVHRQGYGSLVHLINHAGAIVDRANFGYPELVPQALASHHTHLRLWQELPNLVDELGPVPVSQHTPDSAAYWTSGTIPYDRALLTHCVKTMFGFEELAEVVDNDSERKAAYEKLRYMM
tara:strand:- start:4532 stop:6211 length:1680 start_codon:yes stop_codon:yes gene_type:complete